MKKVLSIIIVAIMMFAIVSCSTQKQDTTTKEITEATDAISTMATEEETTETTAESTKETIPYETVHVTDETTTEKNEEVEGDCRGVWRVETVFIHHGSDAASNITYHDVSDQLLSVYIYENSIYMGSTDSIIQQYRRMGDVIFDEDEHGKTITIRLLSLASGKSLTAEYHYYMERDKWGTIKLHLDLKSLNGDPTRFGFDSFMNSHCGIEMSEWAFAKADSEHDPMLYRSEDTLWLTGMGGKTETIRFTYGDNFIVYINQQIAGTWRTIDRGEEKLLIITYQDGHIVEGTYSVGSRNMSIKWEGIEMETMYSVAELEY